MASMFIPFTHICILSIYICQLYFPKESRYAQFQALDLG